MNNFISNIHTMFRVPSTVLICGASGSGKTTFVSNLLKYRNQMIENGENIKNIIFFYNNWQPLYQEMKENKLVTEWINELPSAKEIKEKSDPFKDKYGTICIIDDFMTEMSKDIIDIFTVISHHSNVLVVFLSQSIFPKNPHFRDLSVNAKYIVLHKNPRENAQVAHLARQIQPVKNKFIIEAYHDATQEPYSYILFNLHQETPENYRIQSNIFPHEHPIVIYFPRY